MQSANLKFVIEQAKDKRQKHPIALAVASAIEVGIVVPSILRAALKKAGYRVIEDQASMAEYGFASLKALKRTLVNNNKDEMVAMGASGDYDDALLHAMLGWFRENPLPESNVPKGLASKKSS